MSTPRPWLPLNALTDGVLESALGAGAKHWLSRWFANPRAIAVKSTRCTGATRLAERALNLATEDASLCFSVDLSWLAKLGASMLGLNPNRTLTALDQNFLEQLGKDAARDLAETCARAFAAGPLVAPAPASTAVDSFDFTLSMGAGAALFHVYASETALVRARRRLAAPHQCARSSPQPLASALEHQPITLGARIGARRLPLSGAVRLGVGDVVVLDRARSEPVEMTVNGAASPQASWRWRESDVRFELDMGDACL